MSLPVKHEEEDEEDVPPPYKPKPKFVDVEAEAEDDSSSEEEDDSSSDESEDDDEEDDDDDDPLLSATRLQDRLAESGFPAQARCAALMGKLFSEVRKIKQDQTDQNEAMRTKLGELKDQLRTLCELIKKVK